MARRPGWLVGIALVLGLVPLGLSPAGPASASTTLNVTATADSNPASGPCQSGSVTPPSPLSLRDAVCVANNLGGTVTISVPSGTYDLSYGELQIGLKGGQNVTITGAGAASTTIDAQGKNRVLNFDPNLVGGIAAEVQGVTITGGSDSTFGGAGIIGGSGNQSQLDTLTIDSSVITGNEANNSAPAVTNNPGGGVQFIGGKLTITNSTISDNSAKSSPGAAIYYQAQAAGTPESFSMAGSTISGNTGANTTGSTVPTDGAVDLAAPATSITMSVSTSAFTGNVLTGTSGPVRGAALTLEGGAATVTGSSFSGNSVSGSGSGGGAIAVVAGSATVRNDRIAGNQASSPAAGSGVDNVSGTVNAADDWWGCNAGPGSTGCDSVSGTVTTNPRLELSAPAVNLTSSGTATVTADVDHDSAGTDLGAVEYGLNGVAETFSDPEPSGTACTPGSVTFNGGTASGSCTFAADGHDGAGHVVVTVDNQSITVPVTIAGPPTVTSQPSDTSASVGGTASFTAAATGYPAPTVQWQVSADGGSTYSNISGATSTTLTFTATAAENGDKYQAVFTSSNGTATTRAATLTIDQAPAITSADHTTFTAGTNGSFTITTTGSPDATVSETGTLPSGVTFTTGAHGTATLSGTPAAGTAGPYPITLQASNGVSPAASQTFTLTVTQAPAITSADRASFTAGTNGSFTITTTGTPDTTVSESGTLPSGVTFTAGPNGTATLSGTPAPGTGGTYPITLYASNGIIPDASQSFTLTVQEAPAFTSATNATFTTGTNGSFAITTTGSPDATVSESGTLPSGVTFTAGSGGTATLSGTPAAGTGGTYPVTLQASNGTDPAASQSFTLTVQEAAAVTSQPADTSVAAGGTASFTAAATGYPAPTVQWQVSADGGSTYSNISGATSTTLTFTATAAENGDKYQAVFTSSSGTATTRAATLTVDQAPAITSADHTTFTAGTNGSFTITTTGLPDATVSESGALPSGVTFSAGSGGTATLSGTPAAGTAGPYPITLQASNGVSPAASQTFTLTVTQAPAITSADTASFGSGAAGTFTVTTSGYPAAALSETGNLPPGVTFTDDGDGTATLAGMTTTAGSYPLSITATSSAGTATQSFTLTVTTAPQTITFTSIPPATPVVGESYAVTATGGGSGNTVTFAIDTTSAGVCTISGSTVTFTSPGACVVDAAQAGSAQYSPATAAQTVPVSQAATSTVVTIHPHTITATVTVVAPGAGTPTGSVAFSVDGTAVGTGTLSGGTATLDYTVPQGKNQSVSAVYGGSSDFSGSSGSTSRQPLSITATVSSSTPQTGYGWYRSAVTITFSCLTNGVPLTAPCPAPVMLTHDGAGQSVTRTITDTDGRSATVTVRGINIDTVAPRVSISGVRSGATYLGSAPAASCAGTDALSGIASCTLSSAANGETVTVTATATDRADNVGTATLSYDVLHFYVLGAPYTNGAFQLHEGQTYTVVALTATGTRPQFYGAAPDGSTPAQPGPYFRAAGHQDGLFQFTLAVRVPQAPGSSTYWNLGVQDDSTVHLIKYHPLS